MKFSKLNHNTNSHPHLRIPVIIIMPVSEFLDETAGSFLKWALLIVGALAIGTVLAKIWCDYHSSGF